ncbi:unnamed protein product [Protopolystoma xenopodis]|uniref:Uncharacterized protein n=1 Tax=Protopolystoma xenopodis TaxID=117903 RepID=A0A448XB86_9PLAT|nr:unnamed protein product [Protopolystoma xenopodis]
MGQAVHLHESIDEAVRGTMESCEDLLTALDEIAARQGHINTIVDTLVRSTAQLGPSKAKHLEISTYLFMLSLFLAYKSVPDKAAAYYVSFVANDRIFFASFIVASNGPKSIDADLETTEEIVQVPVEARFYDYQIRMLNLARHMDQLTLDIEQRALRPGSASDLAPLALGITQIGHTGRQYSDLVGSLFLPHSSTE